MALSNSISLLFISSKAFNSNAIRERERIGVSEINWGPLFLSLLEFMMYKYLNGLYIVEEYELCICVGGFVLF